MQHDQQSSDFGIKLIQKFLILIIFFEFCYSCSLLIRLTYDIPLAGGRFDNFVKSYKLYIFNKYIFEAYNEQRKYNIEIKEDRLNGSTADQVQQYY
jgi:hypothetical protein